MVTGITLQRELDHTTTFIVNYNCKYSRFFSLSSFANSDKSDLNYTRNTEKYLIELLSLSV